MPPALELRLLGRVREVPRATWDTLAEGALSPFVEHAWLDCLEEAGCVGEAAGWVPHHFALYRGERLIAVAPAYLKGNSEGEFVYDWAWADLSHRIGVPYYPKLVFAVPFTPVTGDRVLARPEDRDLATRIFAEAARQVTDTLGLSGVHVLFPSEAEARAWRDAGYLHRTHIQYHWRNAGYASWDEFLARFNSKRRNQLKRESAQPAKDGIVIETLSPDALPAAARAMHELYASTVDKFYYGRRYLNRKFFELVAESFSHRLSWVAAKKDGKIVAGAFNVRKGDRLFGRYWGTKVDLPFLHFNVCYYHGIRECIAKGLAVFEPGAGGEHKLFRGFDPTLTHSAHHLRDTRLRGILAAFLERERAAVAHSVSAGPTS
jgi:predicted N-acyltransferase